MRFGSASASQVGMSGRRPSVAIRATWMVGRVDTSRWSTAVASCTSVPVSARAQSIWLRPTWASAASSRVASSFTPGIASSRCRSMVSRKGHLAHTAYFFGSSATPSSTRNPTIQSRASALVGNRWTSALTISAFVLNCSNIPPSPCAVRPGDRWRRPSGDSQKRPDGRIGQLVNVSNQITRPP